jgi:polysaccharide pyruvyl transferase WcaK-like protein
MAILGLLDIVISTRLHPLILALQMNTTAIGVDLLEKVRSFCRLHNLPIIMIHNPTESYNLLKEVIAQKIMEKCIPKDLEK